MGKASVMWKNLTVEITEQADGLYQFSLVSASPYHRWDLTVDKKFLIMVKQLLEHKLGEPDNDDEQ